MMDICAAVEKRFTEALGINTAAIGRSTIERIISHAVKRTGVADAACYLSLLSTLPDEVENCLEELVVPETWFFRDREPFILLQQHLCGRWFPSHPGETARILSLPCSTGEEPYSIAMTLMEAGVTPGQFHLDAADISNRALAAAKRAEYGKGSFREPLTPTQESFFIGVSRRRKVDDAVIRKVHFQRENIIDPNLLEGCEPYHIIFCRNVLIYLTDEARQRVLANINRLLAPDGLLFTGHAEMGIFQQQGYTAVPHPRAFACRRTGKTPPLAQRWNRFEISPQNEPAPSGDRFETRPQNTEIRPRQDTPPAPSGDRFEIRPQGTRPQEAAAGGALHAEALALADRGLFDEAEALCRRYLQEQNPHADVYCLLGLIHEAARHLGEAEECYLKVLYLDPDHYETLVHLSLLYRQRGDGRNASLLRRRAEAAERRTHGNAGA